MCVLVLIYFDVFDCLDVLHLLGFMLVWFCCF